VIPALTLASEGRKYRYLLVKDDIYIATKGEKKKGKKKRKRKKRKGKTGRVARDKFKK